MEPTEAEAAAEVWWKQHSAQYLATSNLKQVFAAGYAAGKRVQTIIKEAEPGFLEKTFAWQEQAAKLGRPDDSPKEDD